MFEDRQSDTHKNPTSTSAVTTGDKSIKLEIICKINGERISNIPGTCKNALRTNI